MLELNSSAYSVDVDVQKNLLGDKRKTCKIEYYSAKFRQALRRLWSWLPESMVLSFQSIKAAHNLTIKSAITSELLRHMPQGPQCKRQHNRWRVIRSEIIHLFMLKLKRMPRLQVLVSELWKGRLIQPRVFCRLENSVLLLSRAIFFAAVSFP